MQLQGKDKLGVLRKLKSYITSNQDLLKKLQDSENCQWSGRDIFSQNGGAIYRVNSIVLVEPEIIYSVCDVIVTKSADGLYNCYIVKSDSAIIWSKMMYGTTVDFNIGKCKKYLETVHNLIVESNSKCPYILRFSMIGTGTENEVLCNWIFRGETERFTMMIEGNRDKELSLIEKTLNILNPKFKNLVGELYYVCPGGKYRSSNKIMYRINDQGEYVVILY